MKIIYKLLFPFLFILASCATVKKDNVFLRDGLIGDVDSVTISGYRNWNNKDRTGVDLIRRINTHYDLSGNIIEQKKYGISKGSLILKSKDEYKYNERNEKTEYIKTTYTPEGELRGVVTQKIKARTPENVIWNTSYWIEGEEKDLEIINESDGFKTKTYYKDLETGKRDLQTIMENYPSGQVSRKTHRSRAVSSIVDYIYYPKSAYLKREDREASFFFSEMLTNEGTEYVYFDSDGRGNWKHRVLLLIRQNVRKGMQYETQEVFYRK